MSRADDGAAARVTRVPEAFVAWVWEQRHFAPALVTTEGAPVQVVYPGRRGGSWGPDFRGALVVISGQLRHGDVEIHLRTRDWALHRHNRDPAYNATILHVVLEHQSGVDARLPNETTLPTVALAASLAAPLPLLLRRWEAAPRCLPPLQPCRSAEEAAALLDAAGAERFEGRTARFAADLTVVSQHQALWAGLCDALGYTSNRVPFRALAARVTAEEAGGLVATRGRFHVAAVLFGEAGLLPHQRGRLPLDAYSAEVERSWAATRRRGPGSPLGWRWVGVRPGNQPVRRVAAAATILRTYCGLDVSILAAIAHGPSDGAPRALIALARQSSDPYWDTHQDFGVPMRRPAALIGADRAREISVNVFLPWAAAVGRTNRDTALETAAEAAYRRHPRLASNSVTRHMARQILGADARLALTNACRQQGLQHLFARWCDDRDCAACSAGGRFQNSDLSLQKARAAQ